MTTRPSTIMQAAELRCRGYVCSHRTRDGRTLPVQLTELLGVIQAEKLYRNATADKLMHVLRWAGWVEDDGFWAMPEKVIPATSDRAAT